MGVSVDEGSQMKKLILDFILENPLSNLNPYPIFTTIMSSTTAEQYAEHLARGINLIKTAGIKIGSITVDGSLAQKKRFLLHWPRLRI